MLNQTEVSHINTCLEFGAEVTITQHAVIAKNPASSAENTQGREANTRTFETPARVAAAVCGNLGL